LIGKNWFKRSFNAKEEYFQILEKVDFENGGNLLSKDIDQMFQLMRNYFSHNQSLNKLVYEENGIETFNDKLRKLYYGKQSFPERIDEFLKLKRVGEQTLSQFLVVFDWFKYPLSTFQMKQILNLDTSLEENAKMVALERYIITDSSKFSYRTIDYLTYEIIYEQIKSILNLDNYYQINIILWKYGEFEWGEIVEEAPYTSLSLEKDLQNYLADNPSYIEKGLTLIEGGKEYNANQIGRIDLLCKDQDGNYVVIELKKKSTGDAVIGQILRYIGWVEENFKGNIRGIIILNEKDEKLDFALKPIKNIVKIKYYRVKFEISDNFQEN